jgi:hypothetical protein
MLEYNEFASSVKGQNNASLKNGSHKTTALQKCKFK